MRKIGKRERAHHEAARVVAAITLGLCVHSASVPPADDPAGTAGARVERAILSAAADPAAQVEALRVDIIVTLAGPAARMKLRPLLKRQELADDLQLVKAWSTWAAFLASDASGVDIAEFGPDGMIELTEEQQAFADRLLTECDDRAHQIVAGRWDDIVRVAKALLDHTMLNADDIDALLGNRRDHTLQLLLGGNPHETEPGSR